MSKAVIKSRRKRCRPSITLILIATNFALLLLPVSGFVVMRLYESALIRQTESGLISQAAFVTAILRERLSARAGLEPSRRSEQERWTPRFAKLDLSEDAIAPLPASPEPTGQAPSQSLMRLSSGVTRVLYDAQDTTLSAMRVVDSAGVVAISTGEDAGLSYAHWPLFQRALAGDRVSQLKRREPPSPAPPLNSISRTSRIRVYYAEPVVIDRSVRAVVMIWRTPPNITQTLWGKRRELAVALLLIIGALGLLTSASLFALRNPLKRLEKLADRTAKGDFAYAQPLQAPVTREVDNLSHSIHAMAQSLNARAEYLRDLSARISHEFKSPITSIGGAAELLIEDDGTMPPGIRTRFISNISNDAERMNRLVSRLMELAQADFKDGGLSAAQQLGEIVASLRARYDSAAVLWQLAPEAEVVSLPAEEIQSILINLIDNALAYGDGNAPVTITARTSPTAILLVVENVGATLSDELTAQMFDPFFTTARDSGGTGLGLPVTKATVDALKGEISVESANDKTRFIVSLPCGDNEFTS